MSIKEEATWAPAPSTTRGQPTQLSVDSKGERLAYANGRSIFLRSVDTPSIATQYTQHTAPTTVARFSPSGFYVASGDVSGTVKVWSAVGEQNTKGDYHIISGRINDLAWDGDSQRIIAVGEGKERMGHCITADSGNSIGEISGHSSQINSVSIRQQRPLRAATGSDDRTTVFYHGAPFKFNTSLREQHNRYIYGVAFSPDGSTLVTVGADKKIWLYDGKTGEARGQIGDGQHTGSIFSVSWAKDSKRFVTSSADQTVKIWDAEAGKCTQSWRLGEEGKISVPDHQVGVVWPSRADNTIISLNLAGDLSYLNEGSPTPSKVVQGSSTTVTALERNYDDKTLWVGSSEGRVFCYDVASGAAERVDGESHSNYVSGIAADSQGQISSVGWDDSIRTMDSSAKTFTGSAVKTDGQPKGIAALSGRKVLVATHKGVEVFVDGKKKGEIKTEYSPVALAATEKVAAVAGDDASLHILSISSTTLKIEQDVAQSGSTISTLSFSPDGSLLAAGYSNGNINVYKCADWSVGISRWSAHIARVTCIAWNKDGSLATSGSLDTNVFVWSVAKPGQRVKAQSAHKDGVNGVVWAQKDSKVISAGQDGALKVWKVDGIL